jgi:fatty-acyl-CoA synthase
LPIKEASANQNSPIRIAAIIAEGIAGIFIGSGLQRFRAAKWECSARAWLQPDGYIKVKDRQKDIIISGGENISSLEVEDVLYSHSAVFAAAVVAQPDPVWVESPCAFIELKPGVEASDAELIEHCRANLAHYKAPKTVVFGPLPKTSTGKIQKYILRQRSGSAGPIE